MAQQLSMPCSQEAEHGIIGGLILDSRLTAEIATVLKAEDFYFDNTRRCYQVILEDFQAGREVTLATVAERAKAEIPWLSDCCSSYLTPYQALEYARLVKQYSQRRQVIRLAYDAITKSQDVTEGEDGLTAILDRLQQGLMECSRGEGEDWEMNSSLMLRHFNSVEKRKSSDGVTGVKSGFSDLDKMTAGWQPGQLIFLGAVPKQGKTTMALHFALNSNTPTLFFTMEMLPEEIADRQFSATAMVDAQKIKNGRLKPADWEKIVAAAGTLSEKPIGWVKKAGLTVTQIKAMCRRFQAEHGLGLVIIDQLDKIAERPFPGEKRTDTIGRTTRALKLMAMDLQVPVICLVQLLDKEVSKRSVPRPGPGDVRDSSFPEQDADIMLYMWRPSFYWPDKQQYKNRAEIIVGRQRSGPTGSVWVTWMPEYVAFANLPWEQWPKGEIA